MNQMNQPRKGFHEATLEVPKKGFHYLGGLPPLDHVKIPQNTAYSRLPRPPMPPVSKKYKDVSKCNAITRPLMKHFFDGQLKVKWYCTEKSLTLECYLPQDCSQPVVVYHAKVDVDVANDGSPYIGIGLAFQATSTKDDEDILSGYVDLMPGSGQYKMRMQRTSDQQEVIDSFHSSRLHYFRQEKEEDAFLDQDNMIMYTACNRIGSGLCRSQFAYISVYDGILSIDEKESLQIIMFQRFLRGKGYQLLHDGMAEVALNLIVDAFVKKCKDMNPPRYKDVVDLKLTHIDILINKGSIDKINDHIDWLAADLEAAKRYSEAAEIYVELAEATELSGISGEALRNNAGLAYKRAQNYTSAEREYVKVLKDAGPELKQCSTCKTTIMNLMVLYDVVNKSVLCGLEGDQHHKNMQRAAYLLTGLLSLAGYDYSNNIILFQRAKQYQTLLRDEYKSERNAFRAFARALKGQNIEEYHQRLFACQNKKFGCFECVPSSTTPEAFKARLIKEQISHNKYSSRTQNNTAPRSSSEYISSAICDGCEVLTKQKDLKECPCRMVRFCSRECQVKHWRGGHKKVCPS